MTPTLSAPKKSSPRSIGKKDLTLREELLAKARESDRHTKALRKQVSELDAEIKLYVLDKEPKKRTLTRCGYRLSIVTVKKSVSWLTEFVKRLGQEVADKIKADAPPTDKLQIEKI